MKKRNCSTCRSQSHHFIIWILCYVKRDFRGQKGKSLTFNISKTTTNLKCSKEQKLLRIMLSTICTFRFFSQTAPLGSYRFGPLKLIFNISRKRKGYLNTYWTNNVRNLKTFDLMSNKRGWPLKLGVKKGPKSFK